MLENKGMKTSAADGTASLEKAMDILEAVGESAQGLSQIELSARLALPRTTLYRLLATLIARGMLRRDPARRVYCLGFRCFEMARSAHAMPELSVAASAELRSLRDLTGETTYLATLDGHEVLSLERCEGAHSQRSQAGLGQRKPLHCTSQGKAILSALDDATRDALLREITLKALTPRTITDRRRLLAEIKITAARGWSVDDEEIVMGAGA
jgi:IclR family acetate operon transcriptional repressor